VLFTPVLAQARHTLGFTLLECLFTVGILALVASAARVGVGEVLAHRRVDLQVWQIRRALELTRSTARAQQRIWTLCLADDRSRCVLEGATRLLIFLDADLSRQHNVGEPIVRDLNLDEHRLSIRLFASRRRYVRFAATGDALESGNFLVCWGDKKNTYQRQVVFYRSGRIRLSAALDVDNAYFNRCQKTA
jgi:prepilin-type N-terminal cleavage/methylation domain-containing protein